MLAGCRVERVEPRPKRTVLPALTRSSLATNQATNYFGDLRSRGNVLLVVPQASVAPAISHVEIFQLLNRADVILDTIT